MRTSAGGRRKGAEDQSRELTAFAQWFAIFGGRELDALEGWLIGVERVAPAGHFDLLSAIYGPGWLEPFAAILDPPEDAEGAP